MQVDEMKMAAVYVTYHRYDVLIFKNIFVSFSV